MKAAPVVVSVVVAWASGCTRGDGIDRTLVTGASAGSVHAEGTHSREWSRLYGASMVDKFRRAATNMDRIVKGAKPAGRPARGAADEVRGGHQGQDRQGSRAGDRPALLARADEMIQ